MYHVYDVFHKAIPIALAGLPSFQVYYGPALTDEKEGYSNCVL